MSNETITLNIVTPEGLALDKTVAFAKLPGKIGEIGILFNHSATLASLKPGKIRIKDSNQQIEKFFVPGGIAHLVNNELTVSTPYLESAENIDIDRAKEAKERAEKRIEKEREAPNFNLERAKKALEKAEARIEIYNLHHNINS